MKKLIILFFCFVSIAAIAQTKKIAYKSHSGSAENFNLALSDNLFDMDNSNFGHAPQRDVVNAQLDSVIFVSDTVALIVTSKFCRRINQTEKQAKLWNSGKETMYKHPLFSRKHSLDSIKRVIKEQYNFQNSVEKVVFVGYDNKRKKYKGNTIIPVVPASGDNNNNSPFDGQFFLILSLITIFSLLGAFIAWWYYQQKQPNEQTIVIV
jgi:hypothetical protein